MKSPAPHGYQIESAWSLSAIMSLLQRWRERAADAADPTYKQVHELLATELERLLQETFDEEISIEQLAVFSGRSVRDVRELVEGGIIPDLGELGRVRVRRRELFASTDRLVQDGRLFDVLLDGILAEPGS